MKHTVHKSPSQLSLRVTTLFQSVALNRGYADHHLSKVLFAIFARVGPFPPTPGLRETEHVRGFVQLPKAVIQVCHLPFVHESDRYRTIGDPFRD
jgi:hypothetical protein